jgi:hypothetical protein
LAWQAVYPPLWLLGFFVILALILAVERCERIAIIPPWLSVRIWVLKYHEKKISKVIIKIETAGLPEGNPAIF